MDVCVQIHFLDSKDSPLNFQREDNLSFTVTSYLLEADILSLCFLFIPLFFFFPLSKLERLIRKKNK